MVHAQKKRGELGSQPSEPYIHVEGSKSQKAMALAIRFPRRTWGMNSEAREYVKSGGFCYRLLKQARMVLRRSKSLAEKVLRGEIPLHAARKMTRGGISQSARC
jgi:uncharacterized protein YfaQ (DUF2300 family)